MTRTLIFVLGLGAAIAFPATASASCGTTQGSFAVTCEQGVQVYRHNALSGIPQGLTPAQASLKSAQLRAKTDRLRIAAQERNSQRASIIRERELEQERYRNRILNSNFRRRSVVGYGTYGSRGSFFGRPVRIRSGSLNIQH